MSDIIFWVFALLYLFGLIFLISKFGEVFDAQLKENEIVFKFAKLITIYTMNIYDIKELRYAKTNDYFKLKSFVFITRFSAKSKQVYIANEKISFVFTPKNSAEFIAKINDLTNK